MAPMDKSGIIGHRSVGCSDDDVVDRSWRRQMKTGPVQLPFGIQLAACHGLPMLVVGLFVAAIGFGMVAMTSRLVAPVTLTAIWLEPHTIPASDVLDQTSIKLGKTGFWTRLCPSYAVETFFDEHGNEMIRGSKHNIDVPRTVGPIDHAPRPVLIPKLLAGTPGRYKLRLDDYSACWPWENIFPIPSTSVEAPFEIVGPSN